MSGKESDKNEQFASDNFIQAPEGMREFQKQILGLRDSARITVNIDVNPGDDEVDAFIEFAKPKLGWPMKIGPEFDKVWKEWNTNHILTEQCQRCGTRIMDATRGCFTICLNCKFPYPNGDCGD